MAEQVVVDPNTALNLVTGFAEYVEIIILVLCSKIGETLPVKDATTHKGVGCTHRVWPWSDALQYVFVPVRLVTARCSILH